MGFKAILSISGHSWTVTVITSQSKRAKLGAGCHKHTEHCRGQLGAEAGTDIKHTCSCLFSLLHEAITALLLCRVCNSSRPGYTRKIYWEQPLRRTGSFPNSQAPATQSTPQASTTLPGQREHKTQKVLILTLGLLLFNSRMQIRIPRWETQPSQGEPADTVHCCMGVDALHEVCYCNVWERGEKLNAHA